MSVTEGKSAILEDYTEHHLGGIFFVCMFASISKSSFLVISFVIRLNRFCYCFHFCFHFVTMGNTLRACNIFAFHPIWKKFSGIVSLTPVNLPYSYKSATIPSSCLGT